MSSAERSLSRGSLGKGTPELRLEGLDYLVEERKRRAHAKAQKHEQAPGIQRLAARSVRRGVASLLGSSVSVQRYQFYHLLG